MICRFTEISNFAQKGEVLRDVVRTFPGHKFFRESTGELMLTRILTAFTLSRPAVGYCQGMNFVCAIVILGRLSAQYPTITSLARSDSEEKDDTPQVDPDSAYCRRVEYDVYVFLLHLSAKGSKIAMHSLWQSGQSQVKLRAFQLDKTLKWMLPKLYHHFREIQLTPEVFVAQWFVTLFSYTVPIQLTMMIWDFIFVDGWPAIFQLALSLLKTLEAHLLERDLEGISSVMRNWRLTERIDVPDLRYEGIIERAHLMPVNEEVLQKLQESFALEMISLSEATLKMPVKEQSMSSSFSNLFMQPQTPPAPAPEMWLERYGDKLTADVAENMLKIRDDLSNMEARTDEDKQQMQSKIVLACEACREAQERLDEAKERHKACIDTVFEITEDLEAALSSAQLVAKAAAMDVDNEDADDDDAFRLSATLDELADHTTPAVDTDSDTVPTSVVVVDAGDKNPFFAMGSEEERVSRTVSVDSTIGTAGLDKGTPEKTNASASASSTAEEGSPNSLALADPEELSLRGEASEGGASGPSVFVVEEATLIQSSISARPSIFRRIGSLLKTQKGEIEPSESPVSPASSGTPQQQQQQQQQVLPQSGARSFFSKSIKV